MSFAWCWVVVIVFVLTTAECAEVFVLSTASGGSCSLASPCGTLAEALTALDGAGEGRHVVTILASGTPLRGDGNCGLVLSTFGLFQRLVVGGLHVVIDGGAARAVIDCEQRARLAVAGPHAESVARYRLELRNVAVQYHYGAPAVAQYGASGGALLVTQSDLTVVNCSFAHGYVPGLFFNALGGAIYADNADVSVTASTFVNHSASVAGTLGFYGTTTAAVSGCSVTESEARSGGWAGGMWCDSFSRCQLDDSVFSNCRASFGGALDFGGASTTHVQRCRFVNCTAQRGGAAYSFGSPQVQLTDCDFDGNSASEGGALRATSLANVTLQRCRFTANAAVNFGGAVAASGYAQLRAVDTLFDSCATDGAGGAVSFTSFARLALTGCTFSRNAARGRGGGAVACYLLSPDADVAVTASLFADNAADAGGALLAVSDAATPPLRLADTLFTGNAARLSGGALLAAGDARLLLGSAVRFVNNSAGRTAGAVGLTQRSSASAVDGGAVFTGNAAFQGGAVCLEQAAVLRMHNASLTANAAQFGGAVAALSGAAALQLDACRFAANTALFGGAVYLAQPVFVAQPATSLARLLFANNTVVRAGGALFFALAATNSTAVAAEQWLPACQQCLYSGNTVSNGWGPDAASDPYRLQLLDTAPALNASAVLWCGRRARLAAQIFDVYDQAYLQGAAENQATLCADGVPSSLRLMGSVTAEPADDSGRVNFADFYLVSAVDGNATLKLDNASVSLTVDLTTPVALPVQLVVNVSLPCPAGWTWRVNDADGYGVCLRVVAIPDGYLIGVGAALAVLLPLFVGLWLWAFAMRSHALLRQSSPLFLMIAIAAALVLLAGAFMWFDSNDAMCALRPWLVSLAAPVGYGAVAVRQFRMWLIFRRLDVGKKTVLTNRRLLVSLAPLVVCPLIVLVVWFAVSPYVRVDDVDWQQRTLTPACHSANRTAETVCLSLLAAFTGLVLLAGLVLSLLSRNIPANYDESYYIGISIYSAAITAIVAVVLVLVLPEPDNVFLVCTIAIIFATASAMAWLMIPKIMLVVRPTRQQRLISRRLENIKEKVAMLSFSSTVQ